MMNDDCDTITGAPAYKGREYWREGIEKQLPSAEDIVSDTPRTDEVSFFSGMEHEYVETEFARQLERKLEATQANLAKLSTIEFSGGILSEEWLAAVERGDCTATDCKVLVDCLRSKQSELSAAQAKLAALTVPGEYRDLPMQLRCDAGLCDIPPEDDTQELRHTMALELEAATAIEQLQARVWELAAENKVLRDGLQRKGKSIWPEFIELRQRAERAEARVAEYREDAEAYRKLVAANFSVRANQ